MLTPDVVKANIEASDWSTQDKMRALELLPHLGRRSMELLHNTIGNIAGKYIAGEVLDALALCLESFEELKAGKIQTLAEIISDAPNNPDWNYGDFIAPFVLDLRQLVRMGRVQDPQLNKLLQSFVVAYYDRLDAEELALIFQSELLYFFQHVKVLEELKLYAFLQLGADNRELTEQFLQSLQKNQEVIGIKDIITSGGLLPPTVGNWIKDFLVTTPQAAQGESTLAQVEYLHKSANVKNLTDSARAELTSVLQLYCWCLEPEINIKETEEYLRQKYTAGDEAQVVLPPDIEAKLRDLKARREHHLS